MAEDDSAETGTTMLAKDALPQITVTDWNFGTQSVLTEGYETQEQKANDEDAAEVLRQMEHYFSEENLPHDGHLLGMFQEGNGTASFNEVCGFKAMRKWTKQSKQKAWVRELLNQSKLIEVIGDSNHPRIRRRLPLQTPLTVTPKLRRNTVAHAAPADQPWLTKGMMKPTGFEEGVDDVVPTAEEQEQDNVDYPADESFTQRIETAVTRYCARRKMHQDVHKVFTKFLSYGGFRCGQAQFIGGVDAAADAGLTAKEKAERNHHYGVWETVIDGLENGKDGTPATWSVDFEGVVKGFLSSHFMECFEWYDQKQVKMATNVLRNFNKYLLLHKVCPEYENQITAAIEVCNLAEEEFPNLAMIDRSLPGDFNVACSMLFGGQHADQLAQGDWACGTDEVSWTREQAFAIVGTSVIAHGTRKQVSAMQTLALDLNAFPVAREFKVGLEIVAVEMPKKAARDVYARAHDRNAMIKPMGTLRCKEWKVPHAPPVDLPAGIRDPRSDPDPTRKYTILLEASTLKYCYPGCKFVATVKMLGNGITWIDYHEATYASFYTWLANEVIRDWKEPGPPKEWMLRQNERRQNGVGMELEQVPEDDVDLDW